MKFYCDNCQAKYSIGDDKVRGKVLKVRCKKCSHIITVREPRAPQARGLGGSAPTAATQVAWYYAINGQSFGPYDQASLTRMFESGELGDACYLWNETFTGWLPAREVSVFVAAIDRGAQIRPRNNTIGVSGALEAIKAPERLDADSSEPEEVEGVAPGQSERIDSLRERLKQHAGPEQRKSPFDRPLEKPSLSLKSPEKKPALAVKAPVSATPKKAQEEEHDPTTQMSVAEISGLLDRNAMEEMAEEAASELDAAFEASISGLHDLSGEGVGSGATEAIDEEDIASQHAPAFALPPSGSSARREHHDSLLADDPGAASIPSFIGSNEGGEESVIDFSRIESKRSEGEAALFAESAAAFDTSASPEQFAATNSLLIQLDSIKKQGRSKRFMIGAGVAALFIVLSGVALVAAKNATSSETTESTTSFEDGSKELVFRTYSKEERSTFLELGGEEVISADDVVEDDEPIEEAPAAPVKETKQAPIKKTPVAVARNDVREKPASDVPNLRGFKEQLANSGSSSRDKAMNDSVRRANNGSSLSTSGNDTASAVKASELPSDPKKNVGLSTVEMLKRQSSSSPKFRAPESSDNKPAAPKFGENGVLSKEDARAGFKKVSRSVASCHQRQVTRGLPVDAPKVYVTVKIEGDGSVSGLKIEPQALESSEFATCMESHRRGGRWKFAEFGGKSIEIKNTYVLQ